MLHLSRTYKTKNIARHLFAIAAVVFVLLSSCPIKFSIKTLAGIPVKTEHSSGKKVNLFSESNTASCTNITTIETEIIQGGFSSVTRNLLPVVIFTAIISLFWGITLNKEKPHLLIRSPKIMGSIPIYLQCRKLII